MQPPSESNRFESLYCEECQAAVPIERSEDGLAIIHCPKCVGECMACDCHLAQACFSDLSKVIVRHAPKPEEK